MPVVSAHRDDRHIRVKLVIPPTLTAKELFLFEKLADASHFNPRALMKGWKMSEPHLPIILGRLEPEQLTLEGLATRGGMHLALLESLMAYGLIEPIEGVGT